MAISGTRFVLKRFNWELYGPRIVRRPGAVAVASFATFEEAGAERARREEELRLRTNPFACGSGVRYWTHLDEPRLRDWLMDHSIDPPEPKTDGPADWVWWWKKNQKKLGAKRARVWEALDKVRFFAVSEEPVRPVGYAVIEINWEHNDELELYDPGPGGGRLVKVFRSRERADEACAARNVAARADWVDEQMADDDDSDDDVVLFDLRERLARRHGLYGHEKLAKREGLFNSAEGAPFFEVIEVELEGLE